MNGTHFKTDQVRWQRPGRSRPRPLGAGGGGAALVLLLVVSLVALAVTTALVVRSATDDAGQQGAGEVETGPGSDAGADGNPTQTSGTASGTGSGSGLVELPAGRDTVDGHPVGFSRDELGAVAVPVELNRSQVGFDYVSAEAVARLYSAPGDEAGVAARARAAVASRRRVLGVAARGAVAAPASFALSPYAYDITRLSPVPGEATDRDNTNSTDGAGRYVVSVLSVASLTDSAGRISQRYYGGTQLVAWSEEVDDWKVLEPTSAEVAQLRRLDRAGSTPEVSIAPGKVRALREAGWTPIATGVNEQVMSR